MFRRVAIQSPRIFKSNSSRLPGFECVPVSRRKLGSTSNGSDPYIVPKAFSMGSIAGLLGSLVGMGGGFVMIPMMTQFLRISQHQAHGTSLFAVAATGISGALGYSASSKPSDEGPRVVLVDAAVAIASCGMITARLGAKVTTAMSAPALRKALGVFMLLVAPTVPARAYLWQSERNSHHGYRNGDLKQLLAPSIIGLCSGFLAGLFGVGGGAIVVPALTIFTDMNHYQALGTSLCAMTLPAAVGTWTHYKKGNLALRVAPPLALGSFIGAYLGGTIGLKTNEETLRWSFTSLMVVLGLQALFRA